MRYIEQDRGKYQESLIVGGLPLQTVPNFGFPPGMAEQRGILAGLISSEFSPDDIANFFQKRGWEVALVRAEDYHDSYLYKVKPGGYLLCMDGRKAPGANSFGPKFPGALDGVVGLRNKKKRGVGKEEYLEAMGIIKQLGYVSTIHGDEDGIDSCAVNANWRRGRVSGFPTNILPRAEVLELVQKQGGAIRRTSGKASRIRSCHQYKKGSDFVTGRQAFLC